MNTLYPEVNQLLDEVQDGLRRVLGERLVGLYLYGSLVTGDFDAAVSDVDLLVVLAGDLTADEFAALDGLHRVLIAAHPAWDNRLEIAYVSLDALKTFRTQTSPIGIISPGEPFHIIDAGNDWLMNWYLVREKGVTLAGPPPATVIDPIAKAEFIDAIRAHVLVWRGYIEHVSHRGAQAYTILTLCRGLYTLEHLEHPSKVQAAAWAQRALPEWAGLIEQALVWRLAQAGPPVDDPAALVETRRFVAMVIERVVEGEGT